MSAVSQQSSQCSEQRWEVICKLSELTTDRGVCALVDGKQIAVFKTRANEAIFAIDNFDPFSQANVLSRGVVGCLNNQLCVASPIYKQHFALASGQCLEDESVKLSTYDVRLIDDSVAVAV